MTEVKILKPNELYVAKRDGTIVLYDGTKIEKAIEKAMTEVEGFVDWDCIHKIEQCINERAKYELLDVEDIQDIVEEKLSKNYYTVAKAYILYRDKRATERNKPIGKQYKYLDEEFLIPFRNKKDTFPSEYGRIVYKRTYARPIPEEKRREDWWETVARVVEFSTDLEVMARERQGQVITPSILSELKDTAQRMYYYMFNLSLFPSGRSLWVGGSKSSYEYPISNYNCSFLTVNEYKKFSEMFFVLMLGTGVGLSVEDKYVSQLPKVNTKIALIHQAYEPVKPKDRLEHTELSQEGKTIMKITVGDSKYAWSRAMELYFDIITKKQYDDIEFVVFNYDNVRPKGEPLKTFGGYASGHGNLKAMFTKIDKVIKKHKGVQWAKVTSLDVLDFATIIAENVVSGGRK